MYLYFYNEFNLGIDKHGRTIVILVGKHIDPCVEMERVFLHFINTLDSVSNSPYVVVYLHGGIRADQLPEFTWLRSVYCSLPKKLREIMCFQFYIL